MKNKKFWVSLLAGIMALIMLLSLVLSVLPAAQAAASSSEIQEQIDAMKADEEAIQAQLDELANQKWENRSEIQEIMDQKSNIDQQVGLLNQQIRSINKQIEAYSLLIADKQEELDEAQQRLQELNEKYKERIRAMEEEGELSYWSVLFQANSFSDFLDRVNMIEEIAAADARRLDELRAAAGEVEEAKAILETEKAAQEETKAQLETKQADLEAKAQQSQALLTELLAKGAEFDALIEDYEDQQANLLDQISGKEQEYDAAKESEHLATATSATTAPPISSGNSGGGNGGTPVDTSGITWLVPVSYGYVSSPYGWREHPISGEWKFHNGVDLAGSGIDGRPIVATRSGKVIYAGWYGAGGWTIGIDHGDGFETYYMHMSDYIVSAGEYVAAGQVIGYVGSTGGSTGPHLHFEVRYNGASVNPMQYIG